MKFRGFYFISIVCIFFLSTFFACTSLETKNQTRVEKANTIEDVKLDRPKDPFDIKMLAISNMLNTGDSSKALVELEKMCKEFPTKNEVKILYASVLMSNGLNKDAKLQLDAILKTEPENVEALYAQAMIEYIEGNTQKQKILLEKIIALDPENTDALSSYGDYFYRIDSYAKAAELYKKTITLEPRNASALLGLGRVLFKDGRYEEASVSLTKSVTINPYDSEAWAELARTTYKIGDTELAMKEYSNAIKNAPNHAWYYLDRGRLYLDQRKLDEALRDFSKAIELEPDYFLPYVYRAGIYEERKQDNKALSDYKNIVALNASYYYAFESIGIISYKQANYTDARVAFQNAYKYLPSQVEYALLAAISLFRDKKNKEAKDYLAKVMGGIDREKYLLDYLTCRLFYDFPRTDTQEVELKIQAEKQLDKKAAMIFFLGEYWSVVGKVELASKYFMQMQDMKRDGGFENGLNEFELEQLKKNEEAK